MTSYKKLNAKVFQTLGSKITEDYVYWKKLTAPVLVKEFGPVDYIDFSSIEPYHFAVTCSVRVQIYNPITKLVVKNLSRFRENAYGATFRSDGRLLCAGSEEKAIKLFDVSTKSMLRLFKGHEAPVHRVLFVQNQPQIVSFSDDKSVRLWDIATEKNLNTYTMHEDYVRSGATNPVVPNVVISGGYDGIVNMYDMRTEKSVLTVKHGSSVESLLYLPSGGIFLSAGGTDIKIWDSIGGGKLLGSISQHHKTITCLRLASDNRRLLSGSLDRHVKIYDVATYKVVHTLDYPNGVLSLGVSKNDDTVVAGLVDGLISVSRREEQLTAPKEKKKLVSFRYISYGHQASSIDAIVPEHKTEKETKYDHCLRKFEYSKALDCVLLPYVVNKTPEKTVTVIRELLRRRALTKALQGREHKSIAQFLKFLIKYMTDYRFTKILIDAANVFLDVYESDILLMPPEITALFINLNKLIGEECELIDKFANLQGAMEMLLCGASAGQEHDSEENRKEKPHNMTPSADAQKTIVFNIS